MYDDEPTMMAPGRPAATLVVRQGPQAGMSFPITGNQLIIGREEGMDIVLQDPESSRRHTRISWQGTHFIIEDLGSTNGTFVNGVQITSPKILSPGDSIGIGQTALVFQGAEGPMGAAQAPMQQAPIYAPPNDIPSEQDNRVTQYILYGCGCLLLLSICVLLGIVAWAVIDPGSFRDVTGIDLGISFRDFESYLNVV
jgi:hypothetical protein